MSPQTTQAQAGKKQISNPSTKPLKDAGLLLACSLDEEAILDLANENNGMILTSVPTFYQLLAKGSLLILAVVIAEYHLNRN